MVRLTGSGPGIGHVHQWARGLGQGLVVDRVSHRGGLLLVGLSKVIVCQQHSGPVICRKREEEEEEREQSRAGRGRHPAVRGRIWLGGAGHEGGAGGILGGRPTDCLHGVPLLDQELRSGNVDVHPQRLLLLVHRVWSPGVLAEACSSSRGQRSV